MAYTPLENLLPKCAGSVYKLVRIASNRALEISETGHNMVHLPSNTKITTIALEEIRQGKVCEKSVAKDYEPKEIKEPKEKVKK